MELIQIIYSIVVYGGVFVVILLVFLFALSKARTTNVNQTKSPELALVTQSIEHSQVQNSHKNNYHTDEQIILRKLSDQQPQIFNIDQTKHREVNIIRKPTFHTATEFTKDSYDERNRNSSRYTVVNEQMKKTNSKVMNFYL